MKRYELISDESGKYMIEDPKGEYVRYEETGDAYKEAVAQNLKLRKALEQCVRVARTWHAMPQKPGDDDAFDIYFNHAPEMKLIRDVLGKMPEPE